MVLVSMIVVTGLVQALSLIKISSHKWRMIILTKLIVTLLVFSPVMDSFFTDQTNTSIFRLLFLSSLFALSKISRLAREQKLFQINRKRFLVESLITDRDIEQADYFQKV